MSSARGAAHQGTLGAVAIPTGADHRDHPSRSPEDLACRPDHGGDAVGGVGVVDDDRGGGVGANPLEPPGDDRHPRDPGGDGGIADPQSAPASRRHRGVGDVEGSGEGDVQFEAPRLVFEDEVGAGEGIGGPAHSKPRRGSGADGEHRDRKRRGNAGAGGIVRPDDGLLALTKQPGLGLLVRGHVPVEIEVVLRQIGESANLESGRGDTAQGERMRRHLDGGDVDPGRGHVAEHALEVGGLRGGMDHRDRPTADAGAHGARNRFGDPGDPADTLDEMGHGGLAVGAGHPDETQPVRGAPMYPRRQRGQGRPGVGHHEGGNSHRRVDDLHAHRRRPSRGRGRNEAMPIGSATPHRHEQHSGCCGPGIVGHVGDGDAAVT